MNEVSALTGVLAIADKSCTESLKGMHSCLGALSSGQCFLSAGKSLAATVECSPVGKCFFFEGEFLLSKEEELAVCWERFSSDGENRVGTKEWLTDVGERTVLPDV